MYVSIHYRPEALKVGGPRRLELPQVRLAGIQLDNQLLVDHRLHFLTRRDARDFTAQGVAVGDEPIGDGSDLGKLQVAQGKLPGLRFVFHRDLVAGLNVVGGDIDVLAVHLDVAMGNELAGGAAGIRKTETEDDVVQSSFQKLEKSLAGNA